MLNFLAQTTEYTFDTTELTTTESTGLALFGGAFLVVWLAVLAVYVVSMWKIFEKAGKPGWAAIIPVYNTWVLAEIAGKPGWWGLFPLLGIVPVLGPIAALVVSVILSLELAKVFGKEPVFAVLLILVPIVGYPMLAFGDAKYTKPQASSKPANPAPAA